MADESADVNTPENNKEEAPLGQRLLNKIWLLAVLAIVFFTVSYIVWGAIDLMMIPVEG